MSGSSAITREEAQSGVVTFLQFCEWSGRTPICRLYDRWRTNDWDLTGHAVSSKTLTRIHGSFSNAIEAERPAYEKLRVAGAEYVGKELGLDRLRVTELWPRREEWRELFGYEP